MMKQGLLAGLVFVIICSSAIWLRLAQHKAAYTPADAQKWVSEVKPQVERITGRKFKWQPQVKLIDTAEIQTVFYEDELPEFKMLHWRYSLSTLRNWAKEQSHRNLGLYVARKRTIYLVPELLNSMQPNHPVDNHWRTELMKLVVAHEMAHCLQDQQTGMEQQFAQSDTVDKKLALRAILEGHARLVTQECSMALGLQRTFGDLTGIWCQASDEDSLFGYQEKTFEQGWRFMIRQEDHGGHPWLWKVLAQPPDSMKLINHPEQYAAWRERAMAAPAIDYSAVLKGLEKHFGNRKWSVITKKLGADDIRELYADLDPADVQEMVSGTIICQGMTAVDGDIDFNIWLAVEKSSELVKRMMLLDRQANEIQLNRLRADGIAVSPTTWVPLKSIQADCASKGTYTTGANKTNTTTIFVGRGCTAVGVVVNGPQISDAKLAEIVEVVFNRLESEAYHPLS